MLASIRRRARSWRNRFKPGCLVLCYHRVSDDTADYWQNAVSIRNFDDHVAMLVRRYDVLSIAQLTAALAAARPPGNRSIVITFDDGYAVNSERACDVLVRHRAAATFYMNSAWLDRDRFWWDELVELMDPQQHGAAAIETVRTRFKVLDDQSREAELMAIRRGRPLTPTRDLAPAREDDIRRIAAEPLFTVGGHTHSHPSLARVPPERQRAEIVQNKRILEDVCGSTVTHFSYPFGGPSDFDETTISELRGAGFASAVTTAAQVLRWPGDPYRIPRLSVKNWTAGHLEHKLDQLWHS